MVLSLCMIERVKKHSSIRSVIDLGLLKPVRNNNHNHNYYG